MRRTILKRGFLLCTVFLLLINICSPCVFADVSAWESPYMPVCPSYLTSGQLPYGPSNTLVICCVPPQGISYRQSYYQWFFVFIDATYNYFFIPQVSSPYVYLNIKAKANIIRYYSTVHSDSPNWVLSEVGTYDSTGSGNFYISNFYIGPEYRIVSNYEPSYWNNTISYAEANGLLPLPSSFTGSLLDSYIAAYPDNINRAISSINGLSAVMEQYYLSLDSALGQIQGGITRIENNLNDLSEGVTGISEEISTGNQEVISEVNQNVNEQVSSAVDDINNAGEDISDIDDDISDVNSIVEKCSEWVSSLDNFADNIDEAESGVAQALENGKTLVNGFLGVAPPIVLALLTFALVFFVVRKVIGR